VRHNFNTKTKRLWLKLFTVNVSLTHMDWKIVHKAYSSKTSSPQLLTKHVTTDE